MKKMKSFLLFCESSSEVSEDLMKYLQVNFKTGETSLVGGEFTKRWIMVDEKMIFLDGNKKYLVDKIYWEVADLFDELDVSIKRRTIKRFLDSIIKEYNFDSNS